MSSISVLRDRLDGRRAGHAAPDDDGVVSIGIGERVAARALEFVVVVFVIQAVVALQRCLLRPRLRIRCGEDRARRLPARGVGGAAAGALLLSLVCSRWCNPTLPRPAAMQ